MRQAFSFWGDGAAGRGDARGAFDMVMDDMPLRCGGIIAYLEDADPGAYAAAACMRHPRADFGLVGTLMEGQGS
jgi:hypothetical protein